MKTHFGDGFAAKGFKGKEDRKKKKKTEKDASFRPFLRMIVIQIKLPS